MGRVEKREMERFSLKIPVKLTFINEGRKHKTLELVTSNICSGGAFLKTEKPLSVGTNVNLDITLPLNKFEFGNRRASCIDVTGSVIRFERKGMAIRFEKKYRLYPY